MDIEVVKPKPDISLAKKIGHFNLLTTDLPFSSSVPCVPGIPLIPAKEAKNRPTLSMR